MSNRLLKFAKRKAAWEDIANNKMSIDEFQKTEFRNRDGGPDLRLSVYETEPDHPTSVRAYAEHAAGAPIDPPKATIAVDTSGLWSALEKTPGNPKFSFIKDRHRELVLNDENNLKQLIKDLLLAISSRREALTKNEVVAYARSRIVANDTEWLAVAHSTEGQEKEWIRKLADTRAGQGEPHGRTINQKG